MEFEFTDSIYVEMYYLEEMYKLCREKNYTPKEALYEVSAGWDDYDYYRVGAVEEQIISVIDMMLDRHASI